MLKNISDYKLFMRKYSPSKLVHLKDDKILDYSDNVLICSWDVFNPKKDFSNGVSAYFLDKGYKVSKFLDDNKNIVFYYCDIIEVEYHDDEIIFNDLLLDLKVFTNDDYEVLDFDDFIDCLKNKSISQKQFSLAMDSLKELVMIVSDGRFDELKKFIKKY